MGAVDDGRVLSVARISSVLDARGMHRGDASTPDTENKFHFGVYRRGLSKAQVLAGKVGTGQGQGRWTPSLDRAEAILALYMRDVTEPENFGGSKARTAVIARSTPRA